MDHAVAVRDVVKTFGDHRAVSGVTFDIARGSTFGLLGPNGAGKTTTIRMILDIIRPDSGEVRVLGKTHGDGVRRHVGYLPEERGLYRKMKVLDMLEFAGTLRGAKPPAARKEAVSWLERLELQGWAQKKVEELSKGMQQKVQFIGAVMGKPEILILDEPFSGMDPVNQNTFKNAILELRRSGATVVFSTHQMETAERLCDSIALIHRGELVLYGPLAEVKAGFGKNSVLLEFEGDASFLKQAPGVSSIDDYGRWVEIRLDAGADPQAVLRAASERLRILKFEIVAPTLHNIFIEKVGASKDAVLERVGDA